ncbi:MAG: molybdopterin-dependent oxidoreductase, partial [Acidobacteriota bacterium]
MTKAPVVRTTCVLDCPDTCSLEVSVENGVIGTIRGSQDHPTTNGFICSKVSQFARRVYHDQRLLYPLRRRGAKGEGDFVRISWDEAIAEITARFRSIIRRHGGEAILPYDYGGSNGFITAEFIDSIYFARLGASRLAKTVCAAPTGEVAKGMYGKMAGVAFEDYPAARLILIWGANPKVSNIHLVPFLKEAKKKGAFIAVVDPVRNFSPALVDLHMPVYPGADLPVALAMIRLWKEAGSLDQAFIGKHAEGLGPLLERARAWTAERAASEARVSPESIRKLATVYAETSPAVLRCGWGVERNRNGGQAVAAILAMPALLGKFGVRGGGYTLSNSGAGRADMSRIWDESSWRTRVLNMTRLGELLTNGLKPPLKAFFVFNCNPVASVPDQKRIIRGLSREDLFTVVFEQVLTDTARYADILLPATTFLEHHDVRRAYGSYVAGGIRPVIEPRGEARSNPDVFAALGRAMGFQDEPFSWSPEEARRRILEATELNGRAANRVVLAAGRAHLYDFPGPSPVQFGTVFPKT